jgi:hypothetical protein
MKMTRKASYLAAAGVALSVGLAPLTPVAAVNLGSVVKGGAIGVLVSTFGKQINHAMNVATGTRSTNVEYTKVVPIISAGQGTYVGAVQVMGTKSRVDRVKAVAEVEGKSGTVRFRALVPVDTLNPTKSPSRVRGVGVTGLIDAKV